MTAQIKLALTLASGLVVCCLGFGTLRCPNQSIGSLLGHRDIGGVGSGGLFLGAIKAVPPTIQPFGGHYIVLGGKIAPGEGSPPRRITIIAFDSMEKAQQWFNSSAAVAARTEAQKFATIRSYFVEGVAN